MCLVKVRQEEDVQVVPYRVVRTRSPSPHRRTSRRVSRTTEVYRESRPLSQSQSQSQSHSRPASASYIAPSASYMAVPTPRPLQVPVPQPVPVFVEPPPPMPMPMPMPTAAPPHHHDHPQGAHYVEVSPRSSVTSHSPDRSDYVVHEREYRRERRDYSPESSPRYEHFRYVEAAEPETEHYERYSRRERSRSRTRGRSRDYDYDYGHGGEDSRRETRERVLVVDDDGRRRREYQR